MADISISDNLGVTANLSIRDDSPLAKAKLTQIISTVTALVSELGGSLDQLDIKSAVCGVNITAPAILAGNDTKLTLKAGANGKISIVKAADKFLFSDDGFAPTVPISPGEAWIGFEVDLSLTGKLGATVDGFGLGLEGDAALALATYVLFPAATRFDEALATTLENFRVDLKAEDLRNQKPGTVVTADLGGTVKLSGSYEVPLNASALASVDLPFNYAIKFQPDASVKLSGSIALTGDFVVRSQKISSSLLRLGIYKKRGSTFTASFTASAGISAELGSTDLISTIFNAVLPGADVSKAGIPADSAKQINELLKKSIDRSLAVSLNASCSASDSDESAAIYDVQLQNGNSASLDGALAAALKGDWTGLARHPNAKKLRNIVTNTKETQLSIAINLLGLYNATTTQDYLRSSTVLIGEDGQITVTDKNQATRISAVAMPYASDPNKLRAVMAEAFLTTAAYVVVAGKLKADLSFAQSYLRYDINMSAEQMKDEVLLGIALELYQASAWTGILAVNRSFSHARVSAVAKHGYKSVLHMFFSDVEHYTPHTEDQFERAGREVLASLVDPHSSSDIGRNRIAILNDDAIWSEMDELGAVASFGEIPYLAHLGTNALADVAADWIAVRWWASAMSAAAPKIRDVLTYIDQNTGLNPATDSGFQNRREALQGALVAVTKNAHADFAGGWGLGVMYKLGDPGDPVSLDFAWASTTRHYERSLKSFDSL